MRSNIFLFILLVFLQIFVLNKILFFDYIIISPIIMFLILFKYNKDSKKSLLIGFFLGLLVDVFNNSLGTYSIICVIIIYFRNLWVLKVVGEERTDELNLLSVQELGNFQFFYYSFPILFLFYSLLSFLESEITISADNILFIILSCVTNYIIMLIFQYLFLKFNFKNEWR
jgi:rod shape-determining protein MreD